MGRLKVTIRRATAADHDMMFLLAEECLHPLAERAGHPERFEPARLLELFARAEAYVAESEAREIAGYVVFDEEGDEVDLRCVCVNPAHEAQMVANQLLDWVEGLALSRGRTRLSALVPADDTPSLHLYRRHEFTARPLEDEPATLVLEKRLPER